MSWSVYTPETVTTRTPVEELLPEPSLPLTDEMAEQFVMARKVIHTILASGVVGNSKKKFRVSASGHANSGHEPCTGWGNDSLTINIFQETPSPE